MPEARLEARCRRIRLLLMDVDGVLTDGSVWLDAEGREIKRFNVRDGQGLKLWRQAGGKCGLVTSRRSAAVAYRAAELGIEQVRQGAVDKLAEVQAICRDEDFSLEETAFVGDDLVDLAAMRAVGLGIAVGDAAPEVRHIARYVARASGGQGAIREIVEWLLKGSNRWEAALEPYLGENS